MLLSSISVRRRITFVMVFIALFGIGVFGLSQLGVDLYPNLVMPQMMIFSQLYGAGPEEVENLVTEYIEKAAASTKGVKKISSVSSPGMCIVTAEFNWGTDMNQAETDMRRSLDQYDNYLPDDATEPMVLLLSASMQPVMLVTFTSDVLNSFDLRQMLDDEINPRLNRLAGVGSVNIQGGLQRQINVNVDPDRMVRNGITISQITGALAGVRNDEPAGNIDIGRMNASLKIGCAFDSLSDVRELVVGVNGMSPVLLEHVAEIEDGMTEIRSFSRINGRDAMLAIVFRRSDANTVNVCSGLEDELSKIASEYGSVMDVQVVFSHADFINESVGNLATTGIQAIFVAFIVLLIFLRSWKSSFVVAVSMPLSIIVTFAAMYFFNVNINIISLAGLALAVGMLVDNSIVVLENVVRHRDEGEDGKTAAVDGAEEVGMAITASTLTTLAVFVPILFVPGLSGQLFRDMSLTISFSLLVSLFIALSLIPLLTSRMKGIANVSRKGKVATRLADAFDSLENWYEKRIDAVLRHRKLILSVAVLLLVISIVLIVYVVPTAFFSESDEGYISGNFYRSPGTELAGTDSTMALVEAGIREIIAEEDLRQIWVAGGTGEGFSALFGANSSNEADLLITLVPRADRQTGIAEYQDSIRAFLEDIPDLEYSFTHGGPMSQTAPVLIRVYDDNLDTLRVVSARVADVLRSIEGTADVSTSMEQQRVEYTFEPDASVLAVRGGIRSLLGMTIADGVMGTQAGFIRRAGDEIPIFVRYGENYRSTPQDFAAIPFMGSQLTSWGNIVEGVTPETIIRMNQTRCATITCKNSNRSLGDVSSDVDAAMDTLDMSGLRYEVTGQIEDQKETFMYLGLAILVAAVLVYMVMASQFESLLEPFIIIFTVPMAFIGVVFTLLVTNTTLSVTAMIGMLMLAGIVVNNGIVLIDFANKLREKEKLNVVRAVAKAGKIRLRPILMTALTTIFAMLPLSLGLGQSGETWAPMARVVMGGLAVGTFLTLFVLPCLYTILGRKRKIG